MYLRGGGEKKENFKESVLENYNVYAAALPPCLKAVSLCNSYWIGNSGGKLRLSLSFFPILRILCLLLFDVQIAVRIESVKRFD